MESVFIRGQKIHASKYDVNARWKMHACRSCLKWIKVSLCFSHTPNSLTKRNMSSSFGNQHISWHSLIPHMQIIRDFFPPTTGFPTICIHHHPKIHHHTTPVRSKRNTYFLKLPHMCYEHSTCPSFPEKEAKRAGSARSDKEPLSDLITTDW